MTSAKKLQQNVQLTLVCITVKFHYHSINGSRKKGGLFQLTPPPRKYEPPKTLVLIGLRTGSLLTAKKLAFNYDKLVFHIQLIHE